MALVQTSFRIRTDATAAQGGTPVWAAAQNTNAAIGAGSPFRIRIAVAATGASGIGALQSEYLFYSKNGGAYAQLSNGNDVSYADPTNGLSADASAISVSLLTSTGTFQNGAYYATGGTSLSAGLTSAHYAEYEFGIAFGSPASDGNTYAFQMQATGKPLDTYTVTPSFNLANHAALAATEVSDTLTGAGNVPRAGRLAAQEVADTLTGSALAILLTGNLAATEANDVLAGAAILPVTAALNATEADDAIVGRAYGIPVGGLGASLAVTEANDALAGLGTGSGDVGSLKVTEADDRLTGAGVSFILAALNAVEADDAVVSETLLWADQWLPIPPPTNVWIEVSPNG